MIHRACYGSIERFFGIVTENYAGAFPLWLSPVQVQVIPVSDKFSEYAQAVTQQLLDQGLRVETDVRPDRVGYKIRDASLQKTPYIFVVGDKEREARTVNVRTRQGSELGAMSVEAFLAAVAAERKPGGTSADFSQVATRSREVS
jgi:threonyl-tRNA synthetase